MKTDLLDQLALELDCNYLSDLKCTENLHRIQLLLEKMDFNDFCVVEWNYVLSYLLDAEVCAQSPVEAAQLLSKKNETN